MQSGLTHRTVLKTGRHREICLGCLEHPFDRLEHVHTRPAPLVALHGTAMRYAAEKRDLAASIAELREITDGLP
jgi:hypothetical protein